VLAEFSIVLFLSICSVLLMFKNMPQMDKSSHDSEYYSAIDLLLGQSHNGN
jgi:hypothetical protein